MAHRLSPYIQCAWPVPLPCPPQYHRTHTYTPARGCPTDLGGRGPSGAHRGRAALLARRFVSLPLRLRPRHLPACRTGVIPVGRGGRVRCLGLCGRCWPNRQGVGAWRGGPAAASPCGSPVSCVCSFSRIWELGLQTFSWELGSGPGRLPGEHSGC